ncbi:hypothetical protein AM1_A0323 (plasmid) [Acaryochloris marina MBIC11017]|uniref:Uncharacterized protein n=1 Tax=Acaryochloris marina (strain MBIC 11017) TaxID=329726 RepID=A8ZKX3_ACAM1|nr:hypothetical protein AM1_A0323 [Acaryochloris marina MBIC11017]
MCSKVSSLALSESLVWFVAFYNNHPDSAAWPHQQNLEIRSQ